MRGTFSYLMTVRPAVGQPRRTHIVTGLVLDAEAFGGAVAMVAAYADRRWGNGHTVVEESRSGEWHVYNGTPDGRAATPYATIVTDTPRNRGEIGIPLEATRAIVLTRDAAAHPASDGRPS